MSCEEKYFHSISQVPLYAPVLGSMLISCKHGIQFHGNPSGWDRTVSNCDIAKKWVLQFSVALFTLREHKTSKLQSTDSASTNHV